MKYHYNNSHGYYYIYFLQLKNKSLELKLQENSCKMLWSLQTEAHRLLLSTPAEREQTEQMIKFIPRKAAQQKNIL